jgi:hypothetical protein
MDETVAPFPPPEGEDRDDEVEGSPVPDPEEEPGTAEDVPQAD